MAKKRKVDPETLARWAEVDREFREMYERRLRQMAEWQAAEARRKERLRRLSFGLLGRA